MLEGKIVNSADRLVDCHAHIIDPERFPFPVGPGYKPRSDERGTSEEYCAVLDRHGISYGVLIQLSGYGTDNEANLATVKAHPGRFKAIIQIDSGASDKQFEDLAAGGAVGVRFNLVSYAADMLSRPDAPRLLQRLKRMQWFAQIYAGDAQWPDTAAVLRASGVRVLVDHLGVVDITGGTRQKGFQTVLALGREGNAIIKLSSLFRVSRMLEGFDDLDPFVDELLRAFGVDNCVWGSDWPCINVPRHPEYSALMTPLERWFPDHADRQRVLARNPQRLFGFGA